MAGETGGPSVRSSGMLAGAPVGGSKWNEASATIGPSSGAVRTVVCTTSSPCPGSNAAVITSVTSESDGTTVGRWTVRLRTSVGALVAANPMGSVTTPGDRHFWAAPFEIDGEFGGLGPDPSAGLGRKLDSRKMRAFLDLANTVPEDRSNTTIAIVATDAQLTKAECQRLATAAHDGIGRATLPAHAPGDGDLVFALTTGTIPHDPSERQLSAICHAAALCLSRAIARAVYFARPAPGDLLPSWSQLNS